MTRTHTFSVRFALAAALGLTVVAGACGSSTSKATPKATTTTAATVDANDSAYCQTARKWMVHEFNGEGDAFVDDPAAFGKYMREYQAFILTAKRQAPAELRNDWKVGYDFSLKQLMPLLEKYDFDIARIQREGSPAELAIAQRADGDPPPAEQRAQGAVKAYEGEVCQTAQPPAADVAFDGAKPNPAYCDAVRAADELAGNVASKKWSIDAVRSLVESDEYAAAYDKLESTAPAVIKADVIADADWSVHQQVDVLEKFGYDARKLVLDGTAADRAMFQKSDPLIANHYARTVAYEEQLCGE